MTKSLLFLICLVLGPAACACSCFNAGPQPCRLPTQATVIFAGRVISVENLGLAADEDASPSASPRYHFAVSETFAGAPAPELDVYSFVLCGYHFEPGQAYLVYAYKDHEGRLQVSMCSQTRPLDSAQALLLQLRAARDRMPVASLFGTIRRTQLPYRQTTVTDYELKLAGAEVRLASADGSVMTARADDSGNYAFYNVPAGRYMLDTNLPQHTAREDRPEVILKGGACEEHDITALPAGRIQGRVVGTDEEPVDEGPVELFLADRYTDQADWRQARWSWVGQDGRFEFNQIAPGDYLIVYNNKDELGRKVSFHRTFYPNSRDLAHATRVHMSEGAQVLGTDIHVGERFENGQDGEIQTRQILVRVAWEGPPPKDMPLFALIQSSKSDIPVFQRLEPGVFFATIQQDARYIIQGESYCRPFAPVRTQPVTLEGESATSELSFTFPKNTCDQVR